MNFNLIKRVKIVFLSAFICGQISFAAHAAHGELKRTIIADSNAFIAEISFAAGFEAKGFYLQNPPRYVVDLEPAILPEAGQAGEEQYDIGTDTIKKVRVAQNSRNPDRVRIVFDLKRDEVVFVLDYNPDTKSLAIREDGAKQQAAGQHKISDSRISKTNTSTTITFDIQKNEADITAEYYAGEGLAHTLAIKFPGYEPEASGGAIQINAGIINKLVWKQDQDGAIATVHTSVPTSYTLDHKKEEGKVVVTINQPSLYGKHVCLDAGHGGKDPGTMGNDGTMEKNVVLDITLRLRELLQAAGVRVTITRTRDRFIPLKERVNIANRARCDLFLSIHGNALPNHHKKPSRRGSQSLYYNDVSKKFARTIQDEMVALMGVGDMGIIERNKLYVIHHTEMQAVIAEVAFLSHRDDLALLRTSEFRDTAARSLYNGLEAYLGMNGARMASVPLPRHVASLIPNRPFTLASNQQPEPVLAETPADLYENASSRPEMLPELARQYPEPVSNTITGRNQIKLQASSRTYTSQYPKEPWNLKRNVSKPLSRRP